MSGRPRRMRENRRSSRGKARRRGGRVVGVGTAAGAFLALGMTPLATAPRAHADLDDLITQPIIDAIAQATSLVDPSLSSAAAPGLDVGSLVAPAAAASADPLVNAAIPLQVKDVTEPVVDLSVNGGSQIPVLVDTGSDGLVVPIQDIDLLQNFSFPTGLGIGGYSGGLDFFYLTFNMPVSFTETDGDTVTTAPTPVDAELFTFPTSLQDLFSYPTSIQAFLAGSADGVLGIGPNATGPGPSSVISALPPDLDEGVLIDESADELVFGPNSLPATVSVGGAPITALDVSVNGGPLEPVTGVIDSGGVYGTIPASIVTGAQVGEQLPAGTEISVYTSDGQTLLYSYTTNGTDGPTVTTGESFDTGYEPFAQYPVYISDSPSGKGTTFFDD